MKKLLVALLMTAAFFGGAETAEAQIGQCTVNPTARLEKGSALTAAEYDQNVNTTRELCQFDISDWPTAGVPLDLGSSTRLILPFGAVNPATCTANSIFFNTAAVAGSNLQLCTATDTWTPVSGLTQEQVEDFVAAQIVTNGSHTGVTASYDDAGDGAIDLVVDHDAAQNYDAGEHVNWSLSGQGTIDPSNYADNTGTDDQNAGEVPFTPAGGILATDVQAALVEVEGNHTVDTTLSEDNVEDFVGGMLGGTQTRIAVTYDDPSGLLSFVVDDMNDDVPEAGDFGNASDLDANGAVLVANLEAGLEALLDLDALQGAVTDAQVPDGITIDFASDAGTLDTLDSTAFALLAGRSGGQALIGGTGAGDNLEFQTTSNASKGEYRFPELTNCDTIDTDADGDLVCGTDASGGGGTPNTLDLGNNGSDESTDLIAFNVTGDTNSIFTESVADELLIDAGQNWPAADAADSVNAGGFGNATDLDANGAVLANSIALGTDTTGGYAASATEGGDALGVAADSVALGGDTTGNYAAGDGEAGAALSGDSATAFFSTGTLEDARVDGSLESDEIDHDATVNYDAGEHTNWSLSGQGTIHATNYVDADTQLSEEQVEDFVGTLLGGTQTRITVTYDDLGDALNFVVDDQSLTVREAGSAIVSSITELDFGAGFDVGDGVTEADITLDLSEVTNAGTDVAADLEEENHAAEHENGGGDQISHDNLLGYDAAEHVNWALSGQGTIHASNYVDNDTQLGAEEVEDFVAAQLVTNGTHAGISFSYDDAGDGAIDATVLADISDHTNLTVSGPITLTGDDLGFDQTAALTLSGDVAFTGTLALPSGTAAPGADGDVLIDTNGDTSTVTNDVLAFQSGGEDFFLFAVREFPSGDGEILAYNSTNGDVEWVSQSGGSAFSALTSGTNTTMAGLIGTGASLGPTGTGTVTANRTPCADDELMDGVGDCITSINADGLGDGWFYWNDATDTLTTEAITGDAAVTSGGVLSLNADVVDDSELVAALTYSGDWAFSGTVAIPSGTAAPTADGDILIDTDGDGTEITNDLPMFQSGGEDFYVPAVREAPTADGQVLAYNDGNGDLEWQAQSGGGGAAVSAFNAEYSPDSYPATADVFATDEFASGEELTWSWQNQGTSSATAELGVLKVVGDNSAGDSIRSYWTSAPDTGDFLAVMKISSWDMTTTIEAVGLVALTGGTEATPTQLNTCFANALGAGSWEFEHLFWTSYTAFGGENGTSGTAYGPLGAANAWGRFDLYVAFEFDDTADEVTCYGSVNGVDWVTQGTDTAITDIDSIGIGLNARGGDDLTANVEWFRIFDDGRTGPDWEVGGTSTAISGVVTHSQEFNAGGLISSGNCADAATFALIASGPQDYGVICTDDDTDTVEASFVLPGGYSAGTDFTFRFYAHNSTSEATTLELDISAQCLADDEAASATWGTEGAASITWAAGQTNDWRVSNDVAITPSNTCAADEVMMWRAQVDAGATGATMTTVNIGAFVVEYEGNIDDTP